MPTPSRTTLYHSNRYSADATCEHCGGVVRHQGWCITVNPAVRYAYEVVSDSAKLTLKDQLILHALGVVWGANKCLATCNTEKAAAIV